MKKQLYAVAALSFGLALSSCGGSEEPKPKTPQEQASDDIDEEFERSMKELDQDVHQMETETTVKTDELKKVENETRKDLKEEKK